MTRGWIFAAVLWFAFSPALLAHELGTTRVNGTFRRDNTYRIEILVDPETLLDRLSILSTGERSSVPPAHELSARITAQASLIVQQVEVSFDGTKVVPRVQYLPVENKISPGGATGPTGILRFEGTIPPDAQSFRWRYALPYTPYLLTLDDEAAPGPERQWVEGGALSKPFSLGKRAVPLTRAQTALMYIRLGFVHIIPKGLDHILFVLGIFLLTTRWRPLLAQVTAFTVAHSVTLALSIYEVVSLPSRLVEPAIALSIAYVGFENVATRNMKPWRIALVFAFGLLHGMGFAGVLHELGIPRAEFATALLGFNVGVELGQLTVVALAWLLLASWAHKKPWYRARIVVPISIFIGLAGLGWMIERSVW